MTSAAMDRPDPSGRGARSINGSMAPTYSLYLRRRSTPYTSAVPALPLTVQVGACTVGRKGFRRPGGPRTVSPQDLAEQEQGGLILNSYVDANFN